VDRPDAQRIGPINVDAPIGKEPVQLPGRSRVVEEGRGLALPDRIAGVPEDDPDRTDCRVAELAERHRSPVATVEHGLPRAVARAPLPVLADVARRKPRPRDPVPLALRRDRTALEHHGRRVVEPTVEEQHEPARVDPRLVPAVGLADVEVSAEAAMAPDAPPGLGQAAAAEDRSDPARADEALADEHVPLTEPEVELAMARSGAPVLVGPVVGHRDASYGNAGRFVRADRPPRPGESPPDRTAAHDAAAGGTPLRVGPGRVAQDGPMVTVP
jgi:hypothetical protein